MCFIFCQCYLLFKKASQWCWVNISSEMSFYMENTSKIHNIFLMKVKHEPGNSNSAYNLSLMILGFYFWAKVQLSLVCNSLLSLLFYAFAAILWCQFVGFLLGFHGWCNTGEENFFWIGVDGWVPDHLLSDMVGICLFRYPDALTHPHFTF